MGRQVPIVDYLVIDDGAPYLNANACEECGALYFDRRNACAKCGKTAFGKKKLADRGKVASYTIVHRAAPNIKVPYVSAIVHLDGGGDVKTSIVNVELGSRGIRAVNVEPGFVAYGERLESMLAKYPGAPVSPPEAIGTAIVWLVQSPDADRTQYPRASSPAAMS